MAWGCHGLAVLAVAEHAGEHGERGGEGVPEAAVVGVGAGVEQQLGGLQRGRPADVGVVAGVRLVEQRRPAVRSAGHTGRRLSSGEVSAQRRDVGAGGGDEQVASGQLGMLGEETARPRRGRRARRRCRSGRPAGGTGRPTARRPGRAGRGSRRGQSRSRRIGEDAPSWRSRARGPGPAGPRSAGTCRRRERSACQRDTRASALGSPLRTARCSSRACLRSCPRSGS